MFDFCEAGNGEEYVDPENFLLNPHSPNVRITSKATTSRSRFPEKEIDPHAHSYADQYVASPHSGQSSQPMASSQIRKPPNLPSGSPHPPRSPHMPHNRSGTEKNQPASRSRSPPVARSANAIDWRNELRQFYISLNMSEKIAGIPTILDTWKGKEDEMIGSIIEKYGNSIPRSSRKRLDELLGILERNTESSFRHRKTPPPPGRR